MGVTFKENCSDTRNSKVIDLIKKIKNITHILKYMILWQIKKRLRKNME